MTTATYNEYRSEKLLGFKLTSSLSIEKLLWLQRMFIFYDIRENIFWFNYWNTLAFFFKNKQKKIYYLSVYKKHKFYFDFSYFEKDCVSSTEHRTKITRTLRPHSCAIEPTQYNGQHFGDGRQEIYLLFWFHETCYVPKFPLTFYILCLFQLLFLLAKNFHNMFKGHFTWSISD